MAEILSPIEEQLRTVEAIVLSCPEVAGLQSYEYFRNNATDLRDAFIAEDITSLVLTYEELNSGKLAEVATKAKQALVGIMGTEKDPKLEALYRAVEYRYSEMFLIDLATQLQNPDLSSEERAELTDWFKLTSEALYGKPDKNIFLGLAKQEITPLLEKEYSAETEAARIQNELTGLIDPLEDTDLQPYEADPEVLSRIKELLEERFNHVIGHVDLEATYSPNEMAEAMRAALSELGGIEDGWEVAIAKNSTSLSVSPHQKLVEVGENRKSLKGEKLRGLVLHELGVHALRCINASRANWLSAAYGQDGYLDFEEGLGNAFEDSYKGEFTKRGVTHYLNVGLAYGLDGNIRRDFRQVYEISWRVEALKKEEAGRIPNQSIEEAKGKAFRNTLRIFRGTPTTIPGLLYLKDLSYFRGQELAWSELSKVQTQDDLDYLLCGKLDLTRKDHREIAYNILESSDDI